MIGRNPEKYLNRTVVKFKCRKCGQYFLRAVPIDKYRYVIDDALFKNSKTCDQCRKRELNSVLKKVPFFRGKEKIIR